MSKALLRKGRAPTPAPAVNPMVRPHDADTEEAMVCARWEAIRAAPRSADKDEAFRLMDDLVRRKGQIRHGGYVYSWSDPEWTFVRRDVAPRNRVLPGPRVRVYSAYAPGKWGAL